MKELWPTHHAVDWSQTRMIDGVERVYYRIRRGEFTGLCDSHARNAAEFIAHPAVNWSRLQDQPNGGPRLVPVTCPNCGEERLMMAKTVSQALRRGTFTGRHWGCPIGFTRARAVVGHGA